MSLDKANIYKGCPRLPRYLACGFLVDCTWVERHSGKAAGTFGGPRLNPDQNLRVRVQILNLTSVLPSLFQPALLIAIPEPSDYQCRRPACKSLPSLLVSVSR